MLSVCQCPLCPEFCSYYVPLFFCKPTGYKRTGPAFSERKLLVDGAVSDPVRPHNQGTKVQPEVFLTKVLRNARPATGIRNPETQNSSKKKLKNYPPGPDPKLLEKNSKRLKNKKNSKIQFSGIFSVVFFVEFF